MTDIELEGIDVEVYTRLHVLAVTISEFATAFGADNDCIQSIEKGIYERSIIEKIFLYYYDNSDMLVGQITFTIDWDVHKLKVADENGNKFEIESKKSILEQLDKSTGEIVRHVNRIRKSLNVKKIESSYQYRSEYNDNRQTHQEAQKYLGHVTGKDRGPRKDNVLFEHTIKCVLDALEELEITISNK